MPAPSRGDSCDGFLRSVRRQAYRVEPEKGSLHEAPEVPEKFELERLWRRRARLRDIGRIVTWTCEDIVFTFECKRYAGTAVLLRRFKWVIASLRGRFERNLRRRKWARILKKEYLRIRELARIWTREVFLRRRDIQRKRAGVLRRIRSALEEGFRPMTDDLLEFWRIRTVVGTTTRSLHDSFGRVENEIRRYRESRSGAQDEEKIDCRNRMSRRGRRLTVFSWNSNGSTDATRKLLISESAMQMNADLVCCQETRQLPEEIEIPEYDTISGRARLDEGGQGMPGHGGVWIGMRKCEIPPFEFRECCQRDGRSTTDCGVERAWVRYDLGDRKIYLASVYWRQLQDTSIIMEMTASFVRTAKFLVEQGHDVIIIGDLNTDARLREDCCMALGQKERRDALMELVEAGFIICPGMERISHTHKMGNAHRRTLIDGCFVSESLRNSTFVSAKDIEEFGHRALVVSVYFQTRGKVNLRKVKSKNMAGLAMAVTDDTNIDSRIMTAACVARAKFSDTNKGDAVTTGLEEAAKRWRRMHSAGNGFRPRVPDALYKLHQLIVRRLTKIKKRLRKCRTPREWKLIQTKGRKLRRDLERIVERIRKREEDRRREGHDQRIAEMLHRHSEKMLHQALKTGTAKRAFVPTRETKDDFTTFWKGVWGRNLNNARFHAQVRKWMKHPGNQCTAVTKKGERCKNKCGIDAGTNRVCHVHRQVLICAAPWREGDGFSILRAEDGRFRSAEVEEVRVALDQMKRRKAPGLSGVTIDLLKDAFDLISGEIVALINSVFGGLTLPEKWVECLLILLHKKGDQSDPKNYRPINLTETMFRLTERVAWNRLRGWIERRLGAEQFGFRCGKSTIDHLAVTRTLVDRAKALGKSLFVASLDLSKAYDSVSHSTIIYKLGQRGLDWHSCRLLYSLLAGHTSLVLREDGSRDEEMKIPMECGVLQGGILSPTEFNIFIDNSILEETTRRYGTKLLGIDCPVAQLLFADDRLLVADSAEDLQALLNAVDEWAVEMNATYNPSKSNILIINGAREERDVDFFLAGERIEIRDEIVVLGMTLSASGDIFRGGAREMGRAIVMGNSKILREGLMSSYSLRKLLNVNVWPRVLYGAEIATHIDEKGLAPVLNSAMRMCLRAPRDTSGAAMQEFLGAVSPILYTRRKMASFVMSAMLKTGLLKRALDVQIEEDLGWWQQVRNALGSGTPHILQFREQLASMDPGVRRAAVAEFKTLKNRVREIISDEVRSEMLLHEVFPDQRFRNLPGIGAELMRMKGISAHHCCSLFFLRYDQTVHYKRHEALEYLITPCCFCRVFGSRKWGHALIDCSGSAMSVSDRRDLLRAQESTRKMMCIVRDEFQILGFDRFARFITGSDIGDIAQRHLEELGSFCEAFFKAKQLEVKYTNSRFKERTERRLKAYQEKVLWRRVHRHDMFCFECRRWMRNPDPSVRFDIPATQGCQRSKTIAKLRNIVKAGTDALTEEDIKYCLIDNTLEVWLAHVREFGTDVARVLLQDWWSTVRERKKNITWEDFLRQGIEYALSAGVVVLPENAPRVDDISWSLRMNSSFCRLVRFRSEIAPSGMGDASSLWIPRNSNLIVTRAITTRYVL